MTGGGTRYMQVYEHIPPVLKRKSRAMRNQYANLWVKLLKLGVEQGEVAPELDLLIVVPYVLGGLNRIPEWYHPAKFRTQDVSAVACSILLNGLTLASTSAPGRSKRRAARHAV